MATTLSTLINAIPQAEAGKLITADYHNTLRDALAEAAATAERALLAVQSSATGARMLSLAPCFYGADKLWDVDTGAANLGVVARDLALPLELRDNETIASIELAGCLHLKVDGELAAALEERVGNNRLSDAIGKYLLQRLQVALYLVPLRSDQVQTIAAEKVALSVHQGKVDSVSFSLILDVSKLQPKSGPLKRYLRVQQQMDIDTDGGRGLELLKRDNLANLQIDHPPLSIWGVLVKLA
jgi:hypothetical protein